MTTRRPLHLFEATGVELEYMIVDRASLSVKPIADRVLEAMGGSGEVEVELGPVAWSNELALHVIEIKTNGPAHSLSSVPALMLDSVRRIDAILGEHGARLMPSGMHPWMDPFTELRLWPHEAGEIYRTFDRIFTCSGHGWANLQSAHVNLPFAGDEEFGRLHAAIRMALPILPAIAASSPLADGRVTGFVDTRMEMYRHNSRRVPSVAGRIVPEQVWSREQYEDELLGGIYHDLRELDPEGVLRHEWVNARGAIARFDRGAIEIRVLDVQETPRADLAVVAGVGALVRALVEGRLGDPQEHRRWSENALGELFERVVRDGERASIDGAYLQSLGFPGVSATAAELWGWLLQTLEDEDLRRLGAPLRTIVEHGPLARRLLRRLGSSPDRAMLRAEYEQLCDCLVGDRLYGVD